ncbi:hypothetical protein D3C76_1066830 [compost metagenome]
MLQQTAGAQAEHAGVPKMLTTLEPGLSGLGIGFLFELGNLETTALQGHALLDIAECRLRPIRFEPERDEPALSRQVPGTVDGQGEGVEVLDQVIGG